MVWNDYQNRLQYAHQKLLLGRILVKEHIGTIIGSQLRFIPPVTMKKKQVPVPFWWQR